MEYNPLEAIQESPRDWVTDKLSGVRRGTVEPVPDQPTNVKDVTPDEQAEAYRQLISAYNNASVDVQFKFIKLLAKHDAEKIREALKLLGA